MKDASCEVTVNYIDATGVKRFTGGKHLKATQSYTKTFGDAVQRVFTLHKAGITSWALMAQKSALHATVKKADLITQDADMWNDAKLDGIFDLLLGES